MRSCSIRFNDTNVLVAERWSLGPLAYHHLEIEIEGKNGLKSNAGQTNTFNLRSCASKWRKNECRQRKSSDDVPSQINKKLPKTTMCVCVCSPFIWRFIDVGSYFVFLSLLFFCLCPRFNHYFFFISFHSIPCVAFAHCLLVDDGLGENAINLISSKAYTTLAHREWDPRKQQKKNTG